MAYTFVGDAQNADFTSGTALATASLSAAVSIGDVILAAFYIGGETVDNSVTFSDSLGNTYTAFTNHSYDSTNKVGMYAAFSVVTNAGTPTVTGTPAATVSFRTVYAAAYRGLSGTKTADAATVALAPGGTTDAIALSTGSASTTSLLWSCCVDQGANATPTAGTGFTRRPSTTARIAGEDKEVTSGAQTATWTATAGSTLDNFQVIAALFPEAGGGQTLTAAAGTFTLAGQGTGMNVALVETFGAFTFSGQAATLSTSTIITAAAGIFTLNGQAATLSQSGNSTLIATSGAFSVTGAPSLSDAGLVATAGVFSLNGIAAGLFASGAQGNASMPRRRWRVILSGVD